jgi:DnaD/phage-associated family protein
MDFKGFPEGKLQLTPVPEAFFRQLLPQIDDLDELKVSIYIFWRLEQQEGAFRCISFGELAEDETFMAGLSAGVASPLDQLDRALHRCVQRGTLLFARLEGQAYYFLNSPKGRAALRAIQSGQWRPDAAGKSAAPLPVERPNIFRLYEENFGPLTPLIAETLGEAEDTYPAEWIQDAMRIAVEKNKRTWRYVEAILKRWEQEGRHGKQEKLKDRPDSAEPGQKYVAGKFSEYIEH